MSSTNVRSNENNPQLCGGEVKPQEDRTLVMPPEKAKRSNSRLEVKMGTNTQVISAANNVTVRDDNNKVIGRATDDGRVLSGDASKVMQALKQNRNSSDRGRD